ncbi:MAG: hypothetical protein ACFNUI_01855 [Negativicutes bacterium]
MNERLIGRSFIFYHCLERRLAVRAVGEAYSLAAEGLCVGQGFVAMAVKFPIDKI